MSEHVQHAAQRYQNISKWAGGWAKGKLSSDPVYDAVITELDGVESVLDVGCGEGYLLALIRQIYPHIRLLGIDHDARRVGLGQAALKDEPHLELQVLDARTAELPSADVVTCLDVLHYMQPEQQNELIVAMAAAVRPGGLLLIREAHADAGVRSWMTAASERTMVALGRHKGDGVYLRPRAELLAAVQAAGLEVDDADCHEGTPFANSLFRARRSTP